MKECPHCHVDAFDEFDLLALDYFSPSICKSCGKLVRNDGLRQLLTPVAVVAALMPGFLILHVVPEWLTPVAWVLIAILGILPLMLLPKPVKLELPQPEGSSFTPDPKNDKGIFVSGWSRDELRQIVDDFIKGDLSGSPPYRVKVRKEREGVFQLTFPDDIHPSTFASLVNQLLYPVEVAIPNRPIIAAGQATLNAAFAGIPESLHGQKAVLYVPEDDQEYDVVYLQTESGATLAISFSEMVWQPVQEPRLSSDVKRLVRGASHVIQNKASGRVFSGEDRRMNEPRM